MFLENINNVSRKDLELSHLALLSENSQLRKYIIMLETRISDLEDKLNTNSSNSGMPPSSDIRKKKSKSTSGNKSLRKPGGQIGHKGNYRKLEANPDRIIVIEAPETCDCGGSTLPMNVEAQKIQKVEIPPIKAEVTEYHLKKGVCSCCGRSVSASLPDGVSRDLLGNNAKSIIAMLTGYYSNSRREVQSIMKDIFNLTISLGLIPATEKRVSNKCEQAYNNMKDSLSDDAIIHMDETVNNYRGKKGYSWVCASALTTILHWSDSRGKKVIEGLFPDYHGYVVSDRYAGYNYFSSSNRQICWSHLKRNFEKFASSTFKEVKLFGELLVSYTNRLFTIYRGYKEGKLPRSYFIRQIGKIRRRLYKYLHCISCQCESVYLRKQANNILKCEDMMWRFIDDVENIPLTNNHAEQQIRRFVIHRKVSFFTWSKTGQEFLDRMLSIFETCKKRHLNPAETLRGLISENIKLLPQSNIA